MRYLRVGLRRTFRIGEVYIRLASVDSSPAVQSVQCDVIMPDRVRIVTPELGRFRQMPPLRIVRNSGQSIVAVWDDLDQLALIRVERIRPYRALLVIAAPDSLRIEVLRDTRAAS